MTIPTRAYIGLGSNLDDPPAQLRRARDELASIPETSLIAFSGIYRSAPMGPQDQPDYCNAVAVLATTLSAGVLLDHLREIELRHGRRRDGQRWQARTLDLDLLLFGQARIDEPGLTVPHPGIAERDFVLVPLAEIAPATLAIPGKGRLGDLLEACPRYVLERIED